MSIEGRIRSYIESLPKQKQADIGELHSIILALVPGARLWFFDGKDETGKVVSNPSIGYGVLDKQYANGKTREFYQVGLSANSSGLSVYIMGLEDRQYLRTTYGADIGKAELTGYCIKFSALKNIDLETLKRAVRGTRSFTDLVAATSEEIIVFGWVAFESREARDLVNRNVAADPSMARLIESSNSGFDAKRMVYGGFEWLV